MRLQRKRSPLTTQTPHHYIVKKTRLRRNGKIFIQQKISRKPKSFKINKNKDLIKTFLFALQTKTKQINYEFYLQTNTIL